LPSKSRIYARNINKTIPVATGNAINIPDKTITSTPRPMFVQRGFPQRNSPVIILSIPTTNKTTASKSAIVINVKPGKASMNAERIMATIPSPICANLIHLGDLVSDKVILDNKGNQVLNI
jgi:hypothetical protein